MQKNFFNFLVCSRYCWIVIIIIIIMYIHICRYIIRLNIHLHIVNNLLLTMKFENKCSKANHNREKYFLLIFRYIKVLELPVL